MAGIGEGCPKQAIHWAGITGLALKQSAQLPISALPSKDNISCTAKAKLELHSPEKADGKPKASVGAEWEFGYREPRWHDELIDRGRHLPL